VFVAIADGKDPNHAACVELIASSDEEFRTIAMVLAEAGYLIDRQLGPTTEADVYRAAANGEFIVEELGLADWERVAELTESYADNDLGGTDSGLVAVAERLGITTIATIDHRHFRVIRPKHIQAFNIVP
jgi:uncharacterized protein